MKETLESLNCCEMIILDILEEIQKMLQSYEQLLFLKRKQQENNQQDDSTELWSNMCVIIKNKVNTLKLQLEDAMQQYAKMNHSSDLKNNNIRILFKETQIALLKHQLEVQNLK